MLKEIVKCINYVDSYIIGYLFCIGVVIFVVKVCIEDNFIKFFLIFMCDILEYQILLLNMFNSL